MRAKFVGVLLGIGLLFSHAAAAQEAVDQSNERGFSVQNFQVAPGYGSFLTTDGSRVDDTSDFELRFGAFANYQYKPLVIQECISVTGSACTEWGDNETAVVKHHLSLDLMGAVSMFGVFEAGLVIPTVLYQSGDDLEDDGPTSVEAPSGAIGISDIRLHLKLDILHGLLGHEEDAISLAFVPVITFPLGNATQEDTFMGDASLTVHPKLAVGSILGRFRLGANLGYLWRQEQDFYLTEVGPRLTYAAAGEYTINHQWSAILEFFGQNGFTGDVTGAPLEGDAAARYKLNDMWEFTAGVGLGIVAGVGTPRVRVFGGAVFRPPINRDLDGDGLVGKADQCPDNPEDFDAFQDEDGCPEPDNDLDDILDVNDGCPNSPEDKDNFEDVDGCPDPDNDEDGILDMRDACPLNPEDKDSFEDENGCPDPDNDGDGICDPWVKDSADPTHGGTCRGVDSCPDKAETVNGQDDEDGCPDRKAEVKQGKIVIVDKVYFEYRTANVLPKSYPVLDDVVAVLKEHPEIQSVRVEGHTDTRGGANYNQRLSASRAAAVLDYLVSKGIEKERLISEGLGERRPMISPEKTPEDYETNRRVEFIILDEPAQQPAP